MFQSGRQNFEQNDYSKLTHLFVGQWIDIIRRDAAGSVHSTPKELENGGFTLKTHQMFYVHSTLRRRNLKTQQSPVILDLCLRLVQGNHLILVTPSFSKGSVFKMFSVRTKTKSRRSSGLKSVFEKLRFRDGLVWTVGLTVEIKLRFQIPPA